MRHVGAGPATYITGRDNGVSPDPPPGYNHNIPSRCAQPVFPSSLYWILAKMSITVTGFETHGAMKIKNKNIQYWHIRHDQMSVSPPPSVEMAPMQWIQIATIHLHTSRSRLLQTLSAMVWHSPSVAVMTLFVPRSKKSPIASSERKSRSCLQIWDRLGTICVLTPNYDGKYHLSSSQFLFLLQQVFFTECWRIVSLCRIGPEKGVIHIALGAVNNALWDMYARSRKKPLWKLIVDMTPVSTVVNFTFQFSHSRSLAYLGRTRQLNCLPVHFRCHHQRRGFGNAQG